MVLEGCGVFGSEVARDFRGAAGNAPIEGDIAPGSLAMVVTEGDAELVTDGLVVRGDNDQTIGTGSGSKLLFGRGTQGKGNADDHGQRDEDQRDSDKHGSGGHDDHVVGADAGANTFTHIALARTRVEFEKFEHGFAGAHLVLGDFAEIGFFLHATGEGYVGERVRAGVAADDVVVVPA